MGYFARVFKCRWPALCALALGAGLLTSGCGRFMAHRIVQAPNRYPSWLAPGARVILSFDESLSTNLPSGYVEVGPPKARLHYRLMQAADYQLKLSSTNWIEGSKQKFQFNYSSEWPGKTNEFTQNPRGTVVLLHGYGLGKFAMVPWAMRLAEDGWRCVLVDLRGHGKSTGKRIFYGLHETQDLSQLLDKLEADGELAQPVSVVGMSYGATLALRWKASDERVGPAVAIVPYAILSNAVMNICREYAPCLPSFLPRWGLEDVPSLLGVAPEELDLLPVLKEHPVKCLLVGAQRDEVTSPQDTQELVAALAPGSHFVLALQSTHETVTFEFEKLATPVETWLREESLDAEGASDDR